MATARAKLRAKQRAALHLGYDTRKHWGRQNWCTCDGPITANPDDDPIINVYTCHDGCYYLKCLQCELPTGFSVFHCDRCLRMGDLPPEMRPKPSSPKLYPRRKRNRKTK